MRATQRQDVNESGALAQLGERNTGSVEVSGSIPLSSTKLKTRLSQDKRVFCLLIMLRGGSQFTKWQGSRSPRG
jgi:hypothetical protein